MKKLSFAILSLLAALQVAVALPVFAATPTPGDQNNPTTLLGQTGLGGGANPTDAANSLPIAIGGVIKIALSFVGMIFVVLMLYAGFLWMTAAGDEGKVETATGTIKRAVIGLIIIMAAYAITSFVIIRLSAPANGGCAPGINAPGC